MRFARLHKLSEFGQELVDVAKGAVYAGKTHISHLVQKTQLGHHLFPDHGRAYLLVAPLGELALDGVGDRFDLIDANGPLVARCAQPTDELLAVELLAPSVLLDDARLDLVHPFVGREPPLARFARTTPADKLAGRRDSRIDDAALEMSTERAFHGRDTTPLPSSTRHPRRTISGSEARQNERGVGSAEPERIAHRVLDS